MLSIKKMGAGVLACTLVLSMAACQSRGTGPASTTIATMPEAQTKTTVAAVQTQGAEDLTKVLDQIVGNVFPGTAGCTMTAVPYTAKLLDWCKSTGLTENEMNAALTTWLQGQDAQEMVRVFSLIRDTYEALYSTTAKDLMDNAGFETDSYPWPDSCRQIMDTLLETLSPKDADVNF